MRALPEPEVGSSASSSAGSTAQRVGAPTCEVARPHCAAIQPLNGLQDPHEMEAHRPLLSVDRSAGTSSSAKHYLLPVDDTDDSEEVGACRKRCPRPA